MDSCEPCKKIAEILEDVKQEKDFDLNEYNIENGEFKERKAGKILLARWGTTKVPLLLFSVDGEVKRALYGGISEITKESILSILLELDPNGSETEEA